MSDASRHLYTISRTPELESLEDSLYKTTPACFFFTISVQRYPCFQRCFVVLSFCACQDDFSFGNALFWAYGFTGGRTYIFKSADGVFIEMEMISHSSNWVGVIYPQEDLKEDKTVPAGLPSLSGIELRASGRFIPASSKFL
jgi:hypothetical protein